MRFQIGSNRPFGEAKGHDVLGRLLAEEVVDAEDLVLGEDLVHLGVERARAREVGAERLLHDHARVRYQASLAEQPDRRARGRGRDAEVVQQARVAANVGDGRPHGCRKTGPAGALRHVRDPSRVVAPRRLAEAVASEVVAGAAREAPEVLVGALVE